MTSHIPGFRVPRKQKATLQQAAQLAEVAMQDVAARADTAITPARVGAKWALVLSVIALLVAGAAFVVAVVR